MHEKEAPGESDLRNDDPHRAPRYELPANPLKGPLVFGVVMATLQMAVILYFAYC